MLWGWWLGVLVLAPGLASAQLTLRQSAFVNGDGSVHVLKDAATSGAVVLLSGNVGGASATGTLTSGTSSLRSRSGIRLTNLLRTVQQFDDDVNGSIDRVTFTFEAPVNNATSAAGIDIGEGTGGSVTSVSADKKTITISSAGVTGTERKTVGLTAAAGILTDDRGNPALFWPPAGRKVTLCGTVDSKGTCYAQVEQDKAKPVLRFTAPAPLDTAVETVNLAYTLSETVKPSADAPVTFTRDRGVADPSTHSTNLGTQVSKGSRNLAISGAGIGLVEGAGYRISTSFKDNADVGDPYTAFNTNTAQVANVIYGKNAGRGFVYVKAGATGTPNGSAANPYPSISAALATLPGAGGNVLVLDGTYTGSYSLGSGVKLRGVGADVTILNGAGGCVVTMDRKQGVELVGFRINGGASSVGAALDDAAVCIYGGAGNAVHHNILTAGKIGVRIESSAVQVSRNTLVQTSTHGAMLYYPEGNAARANAALRDNIIVAPSSGTCVYLEIPASLVALAGTIVSSNVLFPTNCGSTSVKAALNSNNTIVNPALNSDLVATAGTALNKGWNTGTEGVDDVTQPEGPVGPIVNAMNMAGLVFAGLAALLVASIVLRRRGKGPR